MAIHYYMIRDIVFWIHVVNTIPFLYIHILKRLSICVVSYRYKCQNIAIVHASLQSLMQTWKSFNRNEASIPTMWLIEFHRNSASHIFVANRNNLDESFVHVTVIYNLGM